MEKLSFEKAKQGLEELKKKRDQLLAEKAGAAAKTSSPATKEAVQPAEVISQTETTEQELSRIEREIKVLSNALGSVADELWSYEETEQAYRVRGKLDNANSALSEIKLLKEDPVKFLTEKLDRAKRNQSGDEDMTARIERYERILHQLGSLNLGNLSLSKLKEALDSLDKRRAEISVEKKEPEATPAKERARTDLPSKPTEAEPAKPTNPKKETVKINLPPRPAKIEPAKIEKSLLDQAREQGFVEGANLIINGVVCRDIRNIEEKKGKICFSYAIPEGRTLGELSAIEGVTFEPAPTPPAEQTEIGMQPTGAPEAAISTPETKNFSCEFIEQKIRQLLDSVEAIKKVNALSVEGRGDRIILTIDFEAKKFLTISGVVTATLKNIPGAIGVREFNVQASKIDTAAIKTFLEPKLEEISEILKSYIENEEDREVKKMEIVDGELVITFNTDASSQPLETSPAAEPEPVAGPESDIQNKTENHTEPESLPAEKPDIIFSYVATDERRKMVTGIILAPDLESAKKKFRRENLFLVEDMAEGSKLEDELSRLKSELEGTSKFNIPKRIKLKKQITEWENTKRMDTEKKTAELEEVANYIEEKLAAGRKLAEKIRKEGDIRTAKFIEDKMQILESDPIKYFTLERDLEKSNLKSALEIETYSEKQKADWGKIYNRDIENYQRMIDILEADF